MSLKNYKIVGLTTLALGLVSTAQAGFVTTSNVASGGPDRKQLFVTGGLGAEAGGGGLFRLDLGVLGLNVLPKALAK